MRSWFKVTLPQWVAWKLPRTVVRFAALRMFAHASTTTYQNRTPDAITIWEALEAWNRPWGGTFPPVDNQLRSEL